jgi:hypothetical protein
VREIALIEVAEMNKQIEEKVVEQLQQEAARNRAPSVALRFLLWPSGSFCGPPVPSVEYTAPDVDPIASCLHFLLRSFFLFRNTNVHDQKNENLYVTLVGALCCRRD